MCSRVPDLASPDFTHGLSFLSLFKMGASVHPLGRGWSQALKTKKLKNLHMSCTYVRIPLGACRNSTFCVFFFVFGKKTRSRVPGLASPDFTHGLSFLSLFKMGASVWPLGRGWSRALKTKNINLHMSCTYVRIPLGACHNSTFCVFFFRFRQKKAFQSSRFSESRFHTQPVFFVSFLNGSFCSTVGPGMKLGPENKKYKSTYELYIHYNTTGCLP
jgi:hypothetical protein